MDNKSHKIDLKWLTCFILGLSTRHSGIKSELYILLSFQSLPGKEV